MKAFSSQLLTIFKKSSQDVDLPLYCGISRYEPDKEHDPLGHLKWTIASMHAKAKGQAAFPTPELKPTPRHPKQQAKLDVEARQKQVEDNWKIYHDKKAKEKLDRQNDEARLTAIRQSIEARFRKMAMMEDPTEEQALMDADIQELDRGYRLLDKADYLDDQPRFKGFHVTPEPPIPSKEPAKPAENPYSLNLNLSRQRELRNDGYIPAARRKTVHFYDPTVPITPPDSAHSNRSFNLGKVFFFLNSSKDDGDNDAQPTKYCGLVKVPIPKPDPLEHLPKEDVELAFTDLTDLPDVGSEPTHDHWRLDENVEFCCHPTCRKRFGLLIRRHHCRVCGDIFCQPHSDLTVPLDEKAAFHPSGTKERACDYCVGQWVAWVENRIADLQADDSEEQAEPIPAPGRANDTYEEELLAESYGGHVWSQF